MDLTPKNIEIQRRRYADHRRRRIPIPKDLRPLFKTCMRCSGRGMIGYGVVENGPNVGVDEQCPVCGGDGFIERGLHIQAIVEGSQISTIIAARRAIIFLTVTWSGPERRARLAFQTAARQLAAEAPQLGIDLYVIDEDSEPIQAWLKSLDIAQFAVLPMGVGSMAWLEFGRPVAYEIAGERLKATDIIGRTRSLWIS